MESLKQWKPKTFDIANYKWLLKERKNKEFLGNGSDKGDCYYTFNELGFRGDSPKKKGTKIMSVGCSHTEGIDVHNHQTWPHILSRMFSDGVDFNLGMSGRSNDYISRSVITWTDELNPSLVLIMYTYPHRREYYNETGGVEPYHPSPWGYFKESKEGKEKWENIASLSNKEEDFINWYKNHLLITNFLKSKEIPFIWNGTFIGTDYTDENRFDGNYPNFPDSHKHATFLQNEKYAKTLFKHIKENFEI
jgi:hypothetical protein